MNTLNLNMEAQHALGEEEKCKRRPLILPFWDFISQYSNDIGHSALNGLHMESLFINQKKAILLIGGKKSK